MITGSFAKDPSCFKKKDRRRLGHQPCALSLLFANLL